MGDSNDKAVRRRVVTPNLGSHAGTADNRLSFDQAYALLERDGREYETSGKVSFVAKADICKKGQHKGERIIRFISKTSGIVSATAYACCNHVAENSMRPVALGRNYARAMIMCSPQMSSAA